MKQLINSVLIVCTLFPYITPSSAQLFGEPLDFQTNGSSYVELSGDNDFGKVSNFQNEFTFEAWIKSSL